MHCHAHRLALASCDAVSSLNSIRDFQRSLVQIWKYFELSPLKSSWLASIQDLSDTKGLKLQRACATRWHSCQAAVLAIHSELIPVWKTLQHFADERKDATAIGLLSLTQNKEFISSLYLLHTVLPLLTRLSKLFQDGDAHFSHIGTAIRECQGGLFVLRNGEDVERNLRRDWERFESYLGPLSESDIIQIHNLTESYCEVLSYSISDRFPHVSVIEAFSCFDPNFCPKEKEDRKYWADDKMTLLCDKFSQVLSDANTMTD